MPRSRTIKSLFSLIFVRGMGIFLGLLISIFIANRLGAGEATDAFFFVRRLVTSFVESLKYVVTAVYVPPLIELFHNTKQDKLKEMWWKHLVKLSIVSVLMAALCAFAAPYIIPILGPGLQQKSVALATHLLRIIIFVVPFALLIAVMTSLLNASNIFSVPEFSAQLPRILMCFVLLFFIPPYGVVTMSWVMLIGTIFAFCTLFRPINKILNQCTGEKETNSKPTIYKIRKRVLPIVLMQIYPQASVWLDYAFASTVSVGSISVLTYGQRLVQLVPGLIAGSIVTIIYTRFSKHEISGDKELKKRSINETQRVGLFVLIPIVAFLFLCSEQIVNLFLNHGVFTAETVGITSSVMRSFAPAILFSFLTNVMIAAIYADRYAPHLKLALIVIICGFSSKLLGLILLIGKYGILSIGIASSISSGFVMVVIFILQDRYLNVRLELEDIVGIGKFFFATLCSIVCMINAKNMIHISQTGAISDKIFYLTWVGVVGFSVFGVVSVLLKANEIRLMKSYFLKK